MSFKCANFNPQTFNNSLLLHLNTSVGPERYKFVPVTHSEITLLAEPCSLTCVLVLYILFLYYISNSCLVGRN